MIEVAYLALSGAVGGLVNCIFEGDLGIMLPNVEVISTIGGQIRTYVYLGFIGSIVIGAAVGHFLGTDPTTAFGLGVSAPFIVESLIEKMQSFRMNGVNLRGVIA